MKIRDFARALLARAPARRESAPPIDRARIKRALATRLPPHLLKDVGGHDG